MGLGGLLSQAILAPPIAPPIADPITLQSLDSSDPAAQPRPPAITMLAAVAPPPPALVQPPAFVAMAPPEPPRPASPIIDEPSTPAYEPTVMGYREKSPALPLPPLPPHDEARPIEKPSLGASRFGVAIPAAPKRAEPAPKAEPVTEQRSVVDDVPIDRYGAISAELAQKRVDRASVLRSHKLDEKRWSAVDRHWKKAIAEQTEKGGRELLGAFDVAYVGAQEKLRKPIGVPEYARILIGLERGEVGKVLAELELQLSDLMRLQRVWTKKIADSPKLAADLAKAVESARKAGR